MQSIPNALIPLVAGVAQRLLNVVDFAGLDPALADVAQALVPSVADCCLIEIAGPDRSALRLAAAAHRDAHRVERVRELRARHAATLPAAIEPVLHRRTDGDDVARELGWSKWITAGIAVRGLPAGLLTLAVEDGRELGARELEFASCISAVAGLFLGSARTASERDELLAVVSHDLRNPLGVILLVVDFLRNDSLPAEVKAQLARLERAAQAMSGIIDDVVDVGRLGTPSSPLALQPVAAAAVLDRACDAAQRAASDRGVLLARQGAETLEFSADPARLSRALELLVSGAVQRTPAGRTVTVGVERRGDAAVWSIEDGVMPASGLPARRRVGPLAWVVAQSVIAAHGGALWLEQGEGGTTIARFSLPLERRAAPPPAAA